MPVRKPDAPLFWVATCNVGGQKWMGYPQRASLLQKVFGGMPCSLIGFQEFGCEPKNPSINNWNSNGDGARSGGLGDAHAEMSIYPGERANDTYINPIAYDRARFTAEEEGTFWQTEDGKYGKGWDGSERGTSYLLLRDNLVLGKRLLHVNTHLDNKGRVSREEGIRQLLDFCRGLYPDTPTIVTADSNISIDDQFGRYNDPGRRSWKDDDMRLPYDLMIEDGFVDAWVVDHPNDPTRPMTFHNFQGQDYSGDGLGTYDTEWIMVRGFKVIKCVVVRDSEGGIYPSDHYPKMVLVTYE